MNVREMGKQTGTFINGKGYSFVLQKQFISVLTGITTYYVTTLKDQNNI